MDSSKHDPKPLYSVGDRVKKTTGYQYPGVVVSVFTNMNGDVRYVVEHRISVGMLHIFNEGQLVHEAF